MVFGINPGAYMFVMQNVCLVLLCAVHFDKVYFFGCCLLSRVVACVIYWNNA